MILIFNSSFLILNCTSLLFDGFKRSNPQNPGRSAIGILFWAE